MFFLDIDNIEATFKNIPFISVDKFNLISFYRKNYMPNNALTLRENIEKYINSHGYDKKPNKIFILTHLSYLGYCYNPVSFYYCYSENDQLIYILAEVNNTPWNERHVYVIKVDINNMDNLQFNKEFHVSPFMPFDLKYSWKYNIPNEQLRLTMTCIKNEPLFYATLKLSRQKITAKKCLLVLFLNPITTQLLHFRIYWQALLLFAKRTPFYAHH